MAYASTLSGRIDSPMAAGALVLFALGILFALHKLTVSLH